MSWNLSLDFTMPPRFIAGSKPQNPPLPPLTASREIDAQAAAGAASSQANPAPIPRIELAAIQKTRAPLTDAAAVSLKSP